MAPHEGLRKILINSDRLSYASPYGSCFRLMNANAVSMTGTVAEAFWSGWVGYSGHLKVKGLMKMKNRTSPLSIEVGKSAQTSFLIFPLQS